MEEYIPESEKFERDMPTVHSDFSHGRNIVGRENYSVPVGYNPKRNRQYQVESLKDLTADNFELLTAIIADHFSSQLKRMVELESYYEARNPHILEREARNQTGEHTKADNRATHPFASFISDFMTSYSVGKPIITKFENAQESWNELIDSINKVNDSDTHNYKLYLDASKFGRAYEQVYFLDGQPRFARLDPMNTLIIYDTQLDPQPLLAIVYDIYPDYVADYADMFKVDIWSATRHVTMRMDQMGNKPQVLSQEDNTLGSVPIIEYQNNDDRFGDYEQVIPLIDLYDAAQSETANYMQDFNDAVMLLYGDLEANSLDPKSLKAMMDMNILALQSGKDQDGNATSVDAKYLTKQMDSVSAEAYKQRLQNDIHKFAKVPDFEDGDFSSNTSGVALKYRLYGTIQYSSIKRRYFAKGLERRYELIADYLAKASKLPTGMDVHNMDIVFVDNLPEDEASLVDRFIQMGQHVSTETALNYVQPAFGFDTDEELARMKGEASEGTEIYEVERTGETVTE
jgi:SPP1 family phage portal protein